MINRNISIHLQDFPNIDFIENEESLIKNMDLVRLVCSTALSIRDQKNLRVRLPLQKLTIIGKNLSQISDFKEIIADEVNVKNVEIQENLEDLAELVLKINFKKIGAKYGSKIKEITKCAKENNFKKGAKNTIEIAGIILENDEFELNLKPKNQENQNEITIPLPDNSCLICLETKLNENLISEGIARDLVRLVQQARKDSNLDISDKIILQIFASSKITKAVQDFENYIKEQVLANELKLCCDEENFKKTSKFVHFAKIEEENLAIGINI